MFEVLNLMAFAGVVYLCVVVVPVVIEKVSSEEFKKAYFSHLSSKKIHSFGK